MLNQFTTPLYKKLIAEFENSGEDTIGSLSVIRKDAFEHFRAKGFPTTKDEDWKFTNLTPFLADDFSLHPADPKEEDVRILVNNALIPDLDAYCLIILNGKLQLGLSVLPDSHEMTVHSLKDISEQPVFSQYVNLNAENKQSMVALNTALFEDGYYLQVHKGITLDKPVQVIHIYTALENVLFQPRNLVIVEPDAKAELIETMVVQKHTGLLFVNSVSHAVVRENAQLVQYKIQDNDSDERILQYHHVTQERSSRYDNFTFCLPGADLIRNNLDVVLDGTSTETHLLGLYLVGEHQLTDNHTAIHHKYPHCESNEIYKGVLLDNGKAVFNGKVFVEREAQKTNAFQQNNNLLLSGKAQVFAKPQLEIFADDVKCSHGCTVGQFDPESLFYLRSRGISEDSSRKLLIEAFMFDVTQKIENGPLKAYVQALIYGKMENSFSSIA